MPVLIKPKKHIYCNYSLNKFVHSTFLIVYRKSHLEVIDLLSIIYEQKSYKVKPQITNKI